jgi:hypothetical protein
MSRMGFTTWIKFAVAGGAATALLIIGLRHFQPRWSIIQGAVIRSDSDVRKQLPIADVQIIANYRGSNLSTESDATGYFRITIPGNVLPGQTVNLSFDHSGYKHVDVPVTIRFRSSLRRLVIAAMPPVGSEIDPDASAARTVVANIRVRYTVNSENEENVGSAVRTFEVANQGNLPCHHQAPCSPDGYWKASTGSIQLDAGAGNQFRDARASCIAGPCPFTRIDSSGYSHGGRIITASALDWAGSAIFLLQAEVFHTSIVSEVRESHPVVFGRGLNFTVPSTAEGVSLVAELGGAEIVFPLSPNLDMSWATCTARIGANQTNASVYQCELKPEYRF